jgi:hypothetical protein
MTLLQLTSKLVSVIIYRIGPRRKHRSLLYSNRLRRRYPVTAAYTYLLRICCLAANVVSLFVLRSLPSNGSTRYSMFNLGLYILFILIAKLGSTTRRLCLALLNLFVRLHIFFLRLLNGFITLTLITLDLHRILSEEFYFA